MMNLEKGKRVIEDNTTLKRTNVLRKHFNSKRVIEDNTTLKQIL